MSGLDGILCGWRTVVLESWTMRGRHVATCSRLRAMRAWKGAKDLFVLEAATIWHMETIEKLKRVQAWLTRASEGYEEREKGLSGVEGELKMTMWGSMMPEKCIQEIKKFYKGLLGIKMGINGVFRGQEGADICRTLSESAVKRLLLPREKVFESCHVAVKC